MKATTPFFRTFIAAVMVVGVMVTMYMCTHPAYGAEPSADVPQLVIVVGYENGKAIGGQVLGIADNLEACQKGLEQMLPELKAKEGIALAAVCTPLPPAPTAVKHKGEASI